MDRRHSAPLAPDAEPDRRGIQPGTDAGAVARRLRSHRPGMGVDAAPGRGYGFSNAGLVAGDGVILVDTLFDLALTREMLAR